MKEWFWLSVTAAMLAASPVLAWRIPDYHVSMLVQQDSTVAVTETIVADFSGDPHHGIFRYIPLTTVDNVGNKYRLRIDVTGVTDEDGSPLQTVKTLGVDKLHLKIGDPHVTVDDLRTYVISYKVRRAVRFFWQRDELYWNAVGSDWEVPIDRATCAVTLPSDVPGGQLNILSFTGAYGATTTDSLGELVDSRTARFQTTRALFPGEGLTIVVGWPKRIVQEPPLGETAKWFLSDNGYFLLVPLFILGLVILWMRAGRDPDTGRSEMVHYEPPENLHPAEMGTLIDERADIQDIAASIVDLAARGYIHIKNEGASGWFGSTVDYEFRLLKPLDELENDPELGDFDRQLLADIFGGAETRTMSDLKNTFYLHIPSLTNSLYQSMMDRGYFTYRPDSVRSVYQFAGFAVIGLGVISLFFLSLADETFMRVPLGWSIGVALCGVALLGAARSMPRKTTKGKNALISVRGFEEYLSRAEAGLIKYQERQGYFERYLPYAMAFGISDKWAKAFDGLDTKAPDWYSGDGAVFRPSIFARDITSASRSWGSAMTSQPRSSGSGGSGSGFSGGSSGGGSGGGGGGAW